MLLVSLTSWSQSLTMANYYMCSSGQYRDNKEFSRFIFSEKWLQGDECFGNVRNTWKGCNDNYQLCCQSRAGWSQWCLLHKLQTSSAISVGKASNPSVGARGLCPPRFCLYCQKSRPTIFRAGLHSDAMSSTPYIWIFWICPWLCSCGAITSVPLF